MTQYTPGPWQLLIEGTEDDCIIRTILGGDPDKPRNLSEVALVTTGSYSDDVEAANARLIAAAPELLEALEKLSELMSMSNAAFTSVNVNAKKAIKKARFG